jgi:hypothetical protein
MHGRNRWQLSIFDHCSEYFALTISSSTLRKYIFCHHQMHKLMNKIFKLQQQAIRLSIVQHDTSIRSRSYVSWYLQEGKPHWLGCSLSTISSLLYARMVLDASSPRSANCKSLLTLFLRFHSVRIRHLLDQIKCPYNYLLSLEFPWTSAPINFTTQVFRHFGLLYIYKQTISFFHKEKRRHGGSFEILIQSHIILGLSAVTMIFFEFPQSSTSEWGIQIRWILYIYKQNVSSFQKERQYIMEVQIYNWELTEVWLD